MSQESYTRYTRTRLHGGGVQNFNFQDVMVRKRHFLEREFLSYIRNTPGGAANWHSNTVAVHTDF